MWRKRFTTTSPGGHCPECGREVRRGTKSCPHCGHPPSRVDWWMLAAAAFLVLAVVGYFSGDRSGAALKAAVAGLAVVLVIKTSGKGTR